DASGLAIGAVLSQGEIGKDRPIAYFSRVLRGAEVRYDTYEKEAYAMIQAVKNFRAYVYGRPFVIVTDHKPLVWFCTATDGNSQVLSIVHDIYENEPIKVIICLGTIRYVPYDERDQIFYEAHKSAIGGHKGGFEYILTIEDQLSKFCIASPLNNMLATTVADVFIKRFICTFGAPKVLLTDQGRNFIKRTHHVLGEYLKQFVSRDNEWNNWLELATFSYNTCVHEGTKFTPYELVFGKVARVPTSEPLHELDCLPTYNDYISKLVNRLINIRELARENLIKAKEKSKEIHDKHIKFVTFKAGENVFLLKGPKPNKFGDHYDGPYKILEVFPNGNVSLKIGSKTKVVHPNHMNIQLFIVMAMYWGCSEAIIGYDCGSKILNMTTISLVDIDECDIEENRVETSLPEIALLQLNEYQHTNAIQCKIEIHRVIQHCGWQSYNSIVSQGINEYIYPISRELCQVAHD
ncbi:GSCOCG00012383001-RA-CDS, partial [Cotesia congregata]